MFDLFNRNKALEEIAMSVIFRTEEYRTFASEFLPEERTVLAVTGGDGVGGSKSPGAQFWTASTTLTAWMEEGASDIHRSEIRLFAKVEDSLLDILHRQLPRDAIIRCWVRLSRDKAEMLLIGLPEAAFHSGLQALLEEQKTPVTANAVDVGQFMLDRSSGLFQARPNWLGQPIELSFDQNEDRKNCFQTARSLLSDQKTWDTKARSFAAESLLSLANQWAQEDNESAEEITQDQFLQRLTLDAIQVYGNCSFDLWFNDGDLFWGHAVLVSGSLCDGITKADMM